MRVAFLGASLLAGLLWEYHGSELTFLCGAGLSAAALLGLLLFIGRERRA